MKTKNLLKKAAALSVLGLLIFHEQQPQAGAPIGKPSAPTNTQGKPTDSFARGRILVIPRAGLSAHSFDQILKEQGGKARKIGQSDIHIVDVPEYAEEAVVKALRNHPHIKAAELDYKFESAMTPNDPYFGSAWHLPKIGAPTAWDTTQGLGTTIAILDSGVDSSHPDLMANIVPGWNFYDNNADTTDVLGHGTAVAGTAAGTSNNSIGITSVAGKSGIMPIRISDASGFGYGSVIVSGLTWVADKGIRVANISYTIAASTMVQAAAQYMKDKGGLVAVGAGNNGLELSITPTTSFIVVSATDENDLKTSWSSYGNFIAIAAPGINIWTTYAGDYHTAAGTSFSSPVVAGTIALMMSANPKLSSYEIEKLLFSTAVDLGDPGRDIYYGYGRVNAGAAVLAAKNATPTVDSTAPSVSITNPKAGATLSGLVPIDVTAQDNIAVSRVELWVNNTNVASDTSSPYAFSWDSSSVPNGTAQIEARAYDAAGNISKTSISVNVSNLSSTTPTLDTQAPALTIVNPVAGNVSGSVTISTSATDNSGPAGITQFLYIDGALKATGTGGTLSTSWNTRQKGLKTGSHTIQAVAKDAAGNTSTASVVVNVVK